VKGCGKRTAEAVHGEEHGYEMAHSDVVIHGRMDFYQKLAGRPAPDWRLATFEIITAAHSPADWLLTWTCHRCGATVRLTKEQGQQLSSRPVCSR
jgi:hypothetical protein